MESKRYLSAALAAILLFALQTGAAGRAHDGGTGNILDDPGFSSRIRGSTTTTVRQNSGTTTTTAAAARTTTTTAASGTTASVSVPSGSGHTPADIRRMWNLLKPVYSGSPYAVAPSWRSPYSTGKLADGFLKDAINTLRFIRYLARVPYDVEMSAELNELAQYGAVISAANGDIDHTPACPSGMNGDFYSKAYKSCSSANLGWGYATLAESLRSYMQDEDTGNMDRLGHRRWLINPPTKYFGFGFADDKTATQVFGPARTDAFDYDYVCWPSWGDFPAEFFHVEDPWSVSLNPAKYKTPSLSGIVVTLKRVSDGKTWTLSSRDGVPSRTGEYFNVNTDGYGVKYCIIFRPDSSVRYSNGDAYHVKLTGVYSASGSPVTIEYDVKFFDMQER